MWLTCSCTVAEAWCDLNIDDLNQQTCTYEKQNCVWSTQCEPCAACACGLCGQWTALGRRGAGVWWPVSGEVSRVVCAIVWSRGARGVSRASLSSLSLDQ